MSGFEPTIPSSPSRRKKNLVATPNGTRTTLYLLRRRRLYSERPISIMFVRPSVRSSVRSSVREDFWTPNNVDLRMKNASTTTPKMIQNYTFSKFVVQITTVKRFLERCWKRDKSISSSRTLTFSRNCS